MFATMPLFEFGGTMFQAKFLGILQTRTILLIPLGTSQSSGM
jgi:hypothetical protein